MAPLGGKKAFLGTNPVSIGMPYRKGSVLFDSAMSVSSRGKILLARERGEKIPKGWAIDEEGNPTTDPEKAIKGALLPDGVKGYAIALLIDLFCGALLGGKFGHELPANFSSQGGFAILVLNPKFFRSYDEYAESFEEYVAKLREVPSEVEIRLPGESKFKAFERSKYVELGEGLLTKLKELAKQVGLDFKLQ
jgi:L-2-hydroxycarboxylate dehydrogenase (NAD+)